MLKRSRNLIVALCSLLLTMPVHAEESSAPQVDLSYITPNAMAAAVIYPSRILAYPELELYPHEVISAVGLKEAGIDPKDITSILAVVEIPAGFPVPGGGLVCKLSKSYSIENILPEVKPMTVEAERDGKPYFRSQSPVGPSLYMPDDQTLIVATEVMMGMMLNAHENNLDGALKKHVAQELKECDFGLSLLVDPVRPMLMAQMQNSPPPPAPFEMVMDIPDLVQAIDVRSGKQEEFYISATIHSQSEQSASILQDILDQLMETGKEIFLAQMAAQQSSEDPVEIAAQQYATRLVTSIMEKVRPVRTENQLTIRGEGNSMASMGTIATLTSLLLPAVQSAREAARRTQSRNNLKQIALAMHNYHDVYLSFPAKASLDKKEKPLLSWRVHLLPFLDQQVLYEQFHLDEPWDSEHNKKLIPLMPLVYKNPNSPEGESTTNYLLPVGAGTLFEKNEGMKIRNIIDGTSNTILVVEANADEAVIWTKPADLRYDPEEPLAGLGDFRPGIFMAALADGSVHAISANVQEELIKGLFTHAGQEYTDWRQIHR